MMRLTLGLCFTALLSTSGFVQPVAAQTDWTYWRGPQFNSVSTDKNLPDSWEPEAGEGSNLVWKREIGSRSTPVIMNGRLYLVSTAHEEVPKKTQEKVVCLDANTGETLWEYAFNVYLSDVPVERVGWSSVAADPETGNVYALGVCGYFCCLDAETGEVKWDRSLHEEFGLLSTYGGRTNFPLIHENNVIVSAVIIGYGETAKPTHRYLAFDKTNGQSVWMSGTRVLPEDTTYSAPVLAVIEGELQMIFASGDGGIHGFQPRTGKSLWSYYLSGHGMNVSPLVVGKYVYCGHSEENLDTTEMGGMVCLDASKRGNLNEDGEVWRITELFAGRTSPMMIDGRLYIADDRAKLHCLNPETGEALGKPVRLGTMMRSNLLYADGKIYANEVNGRCYVLKPTEDGAEIIHRLRLPSGEESHGSPISWNSHLYIPTTGSMYCVAKPDVEPAADPWPELPGEAPRSADLEPAQVQVTPAESLLRPGMRQRFQVRLYNAKGQYLRLAEASELEFAADGPGAVDVDGAYVIEADQSEPAVVTVTAKFGELSGTARVRVVPDLNWEFTFDDGEVPAAWIGCAYRHVGLDWDLLSKLNGESQRTGDIYIYLRSSFVNSGAPALTFDDSTPAQKWTDLLRFLRIAAGDEKPKTVDEAKESLGPALDRLKEEGFLAGYEWSTWDRPTGVENETVAEPRLKVVRGKREVDGNGVLTKITTIPKGTRSQGWMGHPDLHDYTIQADVLAFERDEKLPDVGLVAQRYTLDMMGASQALTMRTWTPQLNRFSASVPFEWEANTWYTMKFRAEAHGDKAVLKAKVWKRGEEEPADWTLTAEDETPNLVGSPGLFGNAKDAEIFYDNLTVTANENP